MEIVPVNMPLVKRDEKLLQIEELINAKRKMLIDKQICNLLNYFLL